MFLLSRADVDEFIRRAGFFEDGEVFLVIGEARVVEDHDLHLMPVRTEMLVVGLHGGGNVPKAVGRDDENRRRFFHARSIARVAEVG